MTTKDYDKQALDFLTKFGLKLSIKKPEKFKAPAWLGEFGTFGRNYHVTLSAKGRKSVSFDFWGSFKDKQNGIDPSAYDVLACISSDVHYYTEDDVCEVMDLESEVEKHGPSATNKRVKSILDFSAKLRSFFTPEELEELAEIS